MDDQDKTECKKWTDLLSEVTFYAFCILVLVILFAPQLLKR